MDLLLSGLIVGVIGFLVSKGLAKKDTVLTICALVVILVLGCALMVVMQGPSKASPVAASQH